MGQGPQAGGTTVKIKGGKLDDVLRGTDGDDVIKGRKGADVLYGEGGADILKGGKGDDNLISGGGVDAMKGGPGRDAFWVERFSDIDAFIDFNPHEDIIIVAEAFPDYSEARATNAASILDLYDGVLYRDGYPEAIIPASVDSLVDTPAILLT